MPSNELMFELILSAITCVVVFLTGNKHRATPYVGVVAETLWLVWCVLYDHRGLLPMNILLLIMWCRAIYLWGKYEKE
jgi:hypothetical protein